MALALRRVWPWLILAQLVLPLAQRAGAAVLPAGFQERLVYGGHPEATAVRFAADGRVFVAEKSGLLWTYDDLSDATATQVADLRASVHNFWDRGLLGLAPHPDWPSTPTLYVLYAHDTWPPDDPRFGDPTQPRWGSGEPSPSTSDPCPSANPPTAEAPGATDQGCVVFGRLSRIEVDLQSLSGTEEVLLEGNWCQQYPSHSTGDLVFGADGFLYASAGEGASFNFADFGQQGLPKNPCDDPPSLVGTPNTGVGAEGGALRSQDVLTPNPESPDPSLRDPTGYHGAILRLDVGTNPPTAPPGNPLLANGVSDDDFIIAVGTRNPFRINDRPGTNEIWVADVGWSTWEELNRIEDVEGVVEDFGWPCYEGSNSGSAAQGGYDQQTLCQRLYGNQGPALPPEIQVVAPYYAYRHADRVVPGELCGTGSSSVTGVEFYSGTNYPSEYDGALFFADSTRACIWTMFAGPGGDPDKTNIAPLVSIASGRVVDLQLGPDGNLYYVDFDNGRVYAIEFFAENEPPTAFLSASPTSGIAPLLVSFDATASSDPEDGSSLLYDWDLDGDGVFGDADTAMPDFVYTEPGARVVTLRVEDMQGASDTASIVITADNTAPTAVIDAPDSGFSWAVNDPVNFAGHGDDPQNGPLPAAQLSWELILHHCSSPGVCHAHAITSFEGVASGQFLAPDHEYPSFLELRLTVEDLPPVDWFDPAWGRRRRLSVDNSGRGALSEVPILVLLDPSRIDYARTRPDGADLRFTDAFGSLLAHEIEHWDPGGTSAIWVKLPQLAAGSTSDFLYLYYDNPAPGPPPDPSTVWSNGFAAVWHLHGDLLDSTANANDGTDAGTSVVPGRIGDARFFDQSSWIDMGTSPSLEITGQLSLLAWVQIADPNLAGAPRVLSKKNAWNDASGYNLEYKPGENNVTTVGSGSDFIRADGVDLDTSWHLLTTTVNGASGRVYVDGVDRTTDSTLSPLVASAQALHVGRRSGGGDFFFGAIDEVRISSVERSADWVDLQFAAMSDTLLAFGSEESPATLSDTASVEIHPLTTDVTIETAPAGLSVSVGGETAVAPVTETLIVGSLNSVSVASPQLLGNAVWVFQSWSDGGEQAHNFSAPAAPAALTASFSQLPECTDGLDNDGDGLVDGADPGCADPDGFETSPALVCDNGLDDDGDGLVDTADPGCPDPTDPDESEPGVVCDDGQDNDGDGLTDLVDPGCADRSDDSEQDPLLACDDGQDNDGDTSVDLADPGCTDPLDSSELDPLVACDDGVDNDGDGLIDHPDDPGCESSLDPDEQGEIIPQVPSLSYRGALVLAAVLLLATLPVLRRGPRVTRGGAGR